jgi:hypothetical protein
MNKTVSRNASVNISVGTGSSSGSITISWQNQ